jgi:uncharacterized protein (UPF0332 family)
MRFNLEKLLEKGLLRRIPKSRIKAQESIKASDSWLKEAENNLKNESLRSCILTSYLAMFHAARAILYSDGLREKSHFAVARYLEDKYARDGSLEKQWVKLLDHYREMRHDDQYSTSFLATEEEAENALNSARDFTVRMRKLLESLG